MFKRLRKHWGLRSNIQLLVVCLVFAITGSAAAYLAKPLLHWMGLNAESTSPLLFWPFRILLIFPIYQILLVFIGFIFGQFKFFWNFEKRMLSHLGFKCFSERP